jgi:hypothetical protein
MRGSELPSTLLPAEAGWTASELDSSHIGPRHAGNVTLKSNTPPCAFSLDLRNWTPRTAATDPAIPWIERRG